MTTPPERTNKLVPRWKGPFAVKRIPNPYQVVYEDGSAWLTIHVNHAKPAKLTALTSRHLPPCLILPSQRLDTSPGISKDLTLMCLLLLFNQPHLPETPLLLQKQQEPRRLPPRFPQASRLPARSHQPIEIRRPSPCLPQQRCSLPPPRWPIKIQDPHLGRCALRD